MARAYAGPLCGYFAASRGGDPDPAALVAGVERWRGDLATALGSRLRVPIDWPEDSADRGAWFDLGESGWTALRLFAFYAERSELELPDRVPAVPELDRDYRQAQDQKFARSNYGQLLACRLWLPVEFPFTARAPLPDGDEAEFGSLPVLGDQLRWLNQRTFAADLAEVEAWAGAPAPRGGELLPAARRGFAALFAAAALAQQRRVPVVVREDSG